MASKPESMTEKLKRISDDKFWKGDTPNYNAVLAWFIRDHYEGPTRSRTLPDAEVVLRALELGEIVNLTSLTRATAVEAKRREAAGYQHKYPHTVVAYEDVADIETSAAVMTTSEIIHYLQWLREIPSNAIKDGDYGDHVLCRVEDKLKAVLQEIAEKRGV